MNNVPEDKLKDRLDYTPVVIDESLENDLRQLVRLAIAEDLDVAVDWTTVTMIDGDRRGACRIVSRADGIAAGVALVPWIIDEFDADLEVEILIDEAARFGPGAPLARLSGSARDLLTTERVTLNLLSRLCGVATLTDRYVAAIAGTSARLYDTRKTTPGWRRLEKYAVTCGGGNNHRTGLYDGFLIKDNHLALSADALTAREAAIRAVSMRGGQMGQLTAPRIVEIEVDGLDQFDDVIDTGIDIILLDNFTLDDLKTAVRRRDALGSSVELEASGTIHLDTIAAVAATGVDRISSGSLTHGATWLDLGMDWSR